MTQHFSRPPGAVGVAQAMKSIAVNSPLRPPGPREGVGLRRRGQGSVESRVKHGDLRNPRQSFFNGANALQAGRVVQRCQFAQFADGTLDLGRNPYRGGKPPASVNHAVPDRVNALDALQMGPGSSLQIRQDARKSLAVLAQVKFFPNLRLARRRRTSRAGRVVESMLPSARSNSCSASKRLNLTLLEPELQTRIFMVHPEEARSSHLAVKMKT